MSLGPPFDASGERLRLGIGAGAAAFLLFAIGFALLTSERTLGEAVTVHVRVRRPGALHTGAVVRMAGQKVGEVAAIRGRPDGLGGGPGPSAPRPAPETPPGPGSLPGVDVEVRLRRQDARQIYKNSAFVTVSPTILAEAVLEIGPPLGEHGERLPREAPLVPVEDGDQLRGVDPADVDQFMYKAYVSLDEVVHLSRELRPDWQEASGALTALSARLKSSLDEGDVRRVDAQGRLALASGRKLVAALTAARVERGPGLLRGLDASATPLVREFQALARGLDELKTRGDELAAALGPDRQRELALAIARIRASADTGQRCAADVEYLLRYFQSGRGTLGGFNADIQIYDELKESHRILKREIQRVLIKRKDPGQRDVR